MNGFSSNCGVDAEQAYLFRHAMLQSAAYQLQLPIERAALHAMALELLQAADGHPAELAGHARAAQVDPQREAAMQELELHWRRQAAQRAMAEWQMLEAVTHVRRGLELPCVTERIRAGGQLMLTVLFMTMGDYNRALAESGPAVEMCRKLDDVEGLQKSLFNAALIHIQLGEYEAATVFNDELLVLTQHGPEGVQRAMALKQRGVLRKSMGDADGAEEALGAALEMARKAGNARETAGVLLDRGIARTASGNPPGAMQDLEEALQLLHSQNDPLRRTIVLRSLSELALTQGRPQEALGHAQAAAQVAQQARLFENIARALETQAHAHETLGQPAEAASARERAREARRLHIG